MSHLSVVIQIRQRLQWMYHRSLANLQRLNNEFGSQYLLMSRPSGNSMWLHSMAMSMVQDPWNYKIWPVGRFLRQDRCKSGINQLVSKMYLFYAKSGLSLPPNNHNHTYHVFPISLWKNVVECVCLGEQLKATNNHDSLDSFLVIQAMLLCHEMLPLIHRRKLDIGPRKKGD